VFSVILLPPDLSNEFPQNRDESKQVKNKCKQSVFCEAFGKSLIDKIANSPARYASLQYGRPEFWTKEQAEMMMIDIRERVSVISFVFLDLFQSFVHVFESLRIAIYETLEFIQVSTVELNPTAAGYSLEDQLKICRTHREKRKQCQACPEIHSHMSFTGGEVALKSFESIGLAFAGGPFVLSGKFHSPHLMHEFDKSGHKGFFGPVLGRTDAIFWVSHLPVESGIQVVIHLESPHPAIDPFAELTAASQSRVDKGGVDIHNGPLRTKPNLCPTSEKFLP
jgi:hypothetical protein